MSTDHIVLADGYALNPGDLSWDSIKSLGKVDIYERTSQSEMIDRCKAAKMVLVNKSRLDESTINQLPNLKYIGVLATGHNVVDMNAAYKRGIVVTNIPAYGTNSVAQHTFALILDLMENLSGHIQDVKYGGWSNQPEFAYTVRTTYELDGKNLGVIGYGKIAKQVINIALAFGMNVLVYTSHREPNDLVQFVSRDDLFKQSDILSLHTSLREDNKEIVNAKNLNLMKASAFVVNTSRGGLINEKDLFDCLATQRIRGAALDVLSEEPPSTSHPLFSLENCIITPHMAWLTKEARQRLLHIAIENIKAFQNGKPVNQVN